MRRGLKATGLVLAVLVSAAAALAVNVWYFKPVAIDLFYTREFARFALDHPQLLSEIRLLPPPFDFYSTRLDDLSPEQERQEAVDAQNALHTLHRYDRASLAGEDALSYDVFAFSAQSKADGAAFVEHAFPVTQLYGPHVDFPRFMIEVHRVTTQAEARDYVSRLRAFPHQIDQLFGALQSRQRHGLAPPRFAARARCHSLTRKCFKAVSRKERNLPRSRCARPRYCFSSTWAKNSCVRSWASSGVCPQRRT